MNAPKPPAFTTPLPYGTAPARAAPSSLPSRRQLLRVAGVAALAGLGLGRRGPWLACAQASELASANTSDPVPEAFWGHQYLSPQGKPIELASLRGHPVLLNFWASWCPPCVKEMPEIDRFHKVFAPRGWRVLGLAIDNPSAVREFLHKVAVGFDIGLAAMDGTELSRILGDDAGGLPFSVMIDSRGHIRHRKLGGTQFAELSAWAHALEAEHLA